MILVVCPNLALDRILEVSNFRASVVQRSAKVTVQPGGKGSNVARVCRQLNDRVVLLGFAGRANSSLITEPLRLAGVEVDVIEAFDEPSRVCTIILDSSGSGHPTVINEESPVIEPGAEDRLVAAASKWMDQCRAVLVTGSLSRGMSDDFYRRIVEKARQRNLFTAVDAAGPPLAHALQARPSFVKLNAHELVGHVGLTRTRLTDIVQYLQGPQVNQTDAGRSLVQCDQLAVTFGEYGAILKTPTTLLFAQPPAVFHTNPIGCGDAFAAGYLHIITATNNIEDAFAFAMACAASEASTLAQGQIDPLQAEILAKAIELTRI